MNEIIKNEVRTLYESFDITKNMYEKGYISTVVNYLSENMPDDQDILDMRNEIRAKMCFLSNEYLNYFISRSEDIIKFMRENINSFDIMIDKVDKNDDSIEYELPELSNENIGYIIESFLKSIDKNILEFYRQIINEGRVLYGTKNNIAFTSLYNSKTIIFIEDLRDIQDICIFLHELSHAYYIYVNNYRIRDRENLQVEIKDEIPSKMMEYKFILFVENNFNKEYFVLKKYYDSIMYECYTKRDHYENLKYLIASVIASNIGDRRFNMTRYFKHVYNKDVFSLINEANNKKRIGKVLRK